VEVLWAHDSSELEDFYRLLILTRKRNSLPVQPYSFIRSLWDVFFPANRLSIVLARKHGVAIAALLLLKHGDRVSAEFSVSDESFNALSPVHLLFWQAIIRSREDGFRILDFGRTSPRDKSLLDFKDRWGTEAVPLCHFYHPAGSTKATDKKEENWRYKMIRAALSLGQLDSVQKTIGSFCYRHLG
jgi:lipid II:glycine glycyltransferase (peptidoglycan interpeptide bridge formation enzyme)